ncbi:MAG TPA: hypothetical protein VK425_10680, partial [Acidimicrobiales bacterium]|nr:hypothetical protein [Acidimicrobiales bacterium]
MHHMRWSVRSVRAGSAIGAVLAALTWPASATATPTRLSATTQTGASAICSAPQAKPAVEGHPHLSSVPALASVRITAQRKGLKVVYSFRSRFVPAPEGVYIAWSIFLYRARADANDSTKLLELQLEDRGAGW